jgi:hypothetical protein
LLSGKPDLDDDIIANELSITPRQTVNLMCRRLAAQGVLVRARGAGGKIVNRLADGNSAAAAPFVPTRRPERAVRVAPSAGKAGVTLCPDDLAKTLIVVPCSKSKRRDALQREGAAKLADSLPQALAGELRGARQEVARRIDIDETTLVPAVERYSGWLYQDGGRDGLRALMEAGAHVIVISGGYGAILGAEPIGMYERKLRLSDWPGRLLERMLVAYALGKGIRSVRAFAARTSPYATVLSRVAWSDAEIEDALLLMPEAGGASGTSPASIGQALAALARNELTADWVSSYRLGLEARR